MMHKEGASAGAIDMIHKEGAVAGASAGAIDMIHKEDP